MSPGDLVFRETSDFTMSDSASFHLAALYSADMRNVAEVELPDLLLFTVVLEPSGPSERQLGSQLPGPSSKVLNLSEYDHFPSRR